MEVNQIIFYLSSPRFNVYLEHADSDYVRAYRIYKANIELSEAFYPVLSMLEICLRNAINEELKVHFGDSYWFKKYLPKEFMPFIIEAERKIVAQHKVLTSDRIVAELSFGFWNRLFNRNYTYLLWKPLRRIFRNILKHHYYIFIFNICLRLLVVITH